MTAEQLEELMRQCGSFEDEWWKVRDRKPGPSAKLMSRDFLKYLAPSLARRVIAAEKLVEALDRVLTKSATIDDTADLLDAIAAYREASKGETSQ